MTQKPNGSKELSPYRLLNDPLPEQREWFAAVDTSSDDHAHLRDYLRILRKRQRLIAGVFVALVASTAIIGFTVHPRFTATAKIQIERQAPRVAPVQGVEQAELPTVDRYDYYQTQYKILESRTMAARVIKGLALDSDPRFLESQKASWLGSVIRSITQALLGPPQERVDEQGVDPLLIDYYLEEMLSISPLRNSRLVEVEFTSRYPDLSAEVANRHVEEYVSSSVEQRLEVTTGAKEFLEAELGKALARVNVSEAALNKYRKEKGIIAIDGGNSDIVSERLGDLNARMTEAQADRIKLEGQYKLIERRDYESLPDVVGSSLVNSLKQEVATLEAEVAELSRRFKPGYPKMREALAREGQAKARLNAEIGKIVGSIRSGYMAAQNREKELSRQLEDQRQRALEQKDVGVEYDTLFREVGTARDLYANLLQRIKDIDVAEEIRVTNVAVVDPAAVPAFPSSPKKLLNIVLAALGGLLMGGAMAFFLEYLDNTLKTPEDVERKLHLPTLGVVPGFDSPSLAYGTAYGDGGRGEGMTIVARGNGKNLPARRGELPSELITVQQPRSVVSEAYRAIRTGILLGSADRPPQVILFTSGSAGEGKTVTAVNQAMTLVQSGGRVLLIDADIRKPRMHKIFRVPNGHGLSTYLAGQSDLQAVVHSVDLEGAANGHEVPDVDGELFILPSGPMPPNPAELLGSRRMRETLGALRESYDYIVVDTPPVLPVTDAAILATVCDGVVLVVRGQETPTEIARKSKERLVSVNANILGVVLNDVDVTSGDYDSYHRYYYSYHDDARGDA